MKSLSISFALGKASSPHGANIAHNRRSVIADNVDVNRIGDNISYVEQDIYSAYEELFSEALEEYNSKQKRTDRKIDCYYEHIANGRREEPFYEAIVQFGDFKTAGVGTEGGEVATKMLDEYMKNFRSRNPNLHIFSAHLHLDEASPHLHIDFVPYYTGGKKNGLSKGVSMRAALLEQGCYPRKGQANQLVAWEERERLEMVRILQKYGLSRDVKDVIRPHLDVDEYKRQEHLKMVTEQMRKNLSADFDKSRIQSELAELRVENREMEKQKSSPWKSFFYSVPEKQSYVMARLTELNIPFRETENGFEAQECYVEKIRKLEKQFKPSEHSHRDTLRDNLDKIIMQSKNYDEVLRRLTENGYTIKTGKYVAVKHKFGSGFIRLKSLGEDYSEQAIKNRLTHKTRFEAATEKNIQSAVKDSAEYMVHKTIRHYTIVFAAGGLPMRRKNKKKPFSWENCEELNQLAELNKKINAGVTLTSLRNEFAELEKFTVDTEALFARVKSGETNYDDVTNSEIEKCLSDYQAKLKETAVTLSLMEKVAGATFVQSLVDEEKQRQQSLFVRNGLKSANDVEIIPPKEEPVIKVGGRKI